MDIFVNTYGAYVHVKDLMFAIKTKDEEGNDQTGTVPAHKVRSLVITSHAAISTDAIRLALTNNVEIVFLHSDGQPYGRVWHSKPGSTSKIRKQQLIASLNQTGLQWTKNWICQKLQNQADFLKDLKKHRTEKHGEFLQDKIDRITNLKLSVQNVQANTTDQIADSLRGWEGTSGRLYFETLSHVLPAHYQFDGRSSRPAKDAFNAFLNYAYGILYSKVEKALIIAGLDPYLGFLHRDDYNHKSMVYDFIEPYRIYADKTVFQLFSAKKVNQSHTNPITNGFTLNKDGKVLLVDAFLNYLDKETIRYNNQNQTRLNALQLDAHQFANTLITPKPELP